MASDDDQLFGAEHVRVYRETGGERGYHWRGTTILLLTTTGRKSGEERTTPLIHRTEANPEAEIQVLDQVIPVRARTAEDDERERLWKLMNEVWPDYDDYQSKTDRTIPVVVLERR
jgi:hypothetical protein